MKEILIIGGCGYIGTALVDHFLEHSDANLTLIDRRRWVGLTIPETVTVHYGSIEQYIDKTFLSQFEVIILLSGQSSVASSDDLLTTFDNNVTVFNQLLSVINRSQKFIYASSSSVYGQTQEEVAVESRSYYGPYNYYDFSKQIIDQVADMSDKEYYGLRFGTVNGFSRNLRTDLMMNSMVSNAVANGVINVYNGHVHRPILGVKDLCRAVAKIVNDGSFEKRGTYNLSSFNSTIRSIADGVQKACSELLTQDVVIQEHTQDRVGVNEAIDHDSDDNHNKENCKLRTTQYDFTISSEKIKTTFDFEFEDDLAKIVESLVTQDKAVEVRSSRSEVWKPFSESKQCRICQHSVIEILNLKDQPLANSYHSPPEKLELYPLGLNVCPRCFHLQNKCVVRPELLFSNYLYVSGTSGTLKAFFLKFAEKCILSSLAPQREAKDLKILDIACNDGSQLNAFRAHGCEITVGVDPAENLYPISTARGHHVIRGFWGAEISKGLHDQYGAFDVIVAQNVFAHVDDVYSFLKSAKLVMNSSTRLYIQTSQADMVKRNEFDTVYHEHLSFFNTKSFYWCCNNVGLRLITVDKAPIHGTSYVFTVMKPSEHELDDCNRADNSAIITESVALQMEREAREGLYSLDTYQRYALWCEQYACKLKDKIITLKATMRLKVIAYGSTAKSNTLLNFVDIDNRMIDYVIDDNPLKVGLLTPGSNIPVKSLDALREESPDKPLAVIVLAWNFFHEIERKIKEVRGHSPTLIMNINPISWSCLF